MVFGIIEVSVLTLLIHAKYQILELKTINFFGGLKRLVLVDCSLS